MKTDEDVRDPRDEEKLIPDYDAEPNLRELDAIRRPDYRETPEGQEYMQRRGALKGFAWLCGIVAVFCLALLFAWLAGRNSPTADRSDGRVAVSEMKTANSDNRVAATVQPSRRIVYAVKQGTDGASTGKVRQMAAGAAVLNARADANADVTTGAADAVGSKAYDDRIEREAREVIHGDFGNNPGREARLGADYAAVQARVNQILHTPA